MEVANLKLGQTIVYDDGRLGHSRVPARILSVTKTMMVVQFGDRADTTTIQFSDRAWMDHLKIKQETAKDQP